MHSSPCTQMVISANIQCLSQTNPVAWENLPHHWNLTLFYTLWIVVELIFVYFVYVETKYVCIRGPCVEYSANALSL